MEIYFDNKLINRIQKLEPDITGYLNENEISGSWGTNKPERSKDIFKTIGLGIYAPKKIIKNS